MSPSNLDICMYLGYSTYRMLPLIKSTLRYIWHCWANLSWVCRIRGQHHSTYSMFFFMGIQDISSYLWSIECMELLCWVRWSHILGRVDHPVGQLSSHLFLSQNKICLTHAYVNLNMTQRNSDGILLAKLGELLDWWFGQSKMLQSIFSQT